MELGPARAKNELDSHFFSCCDHYPGVVAVRHSYNAYQRMSVLDLHDWRNSGGLECWIPLGYQEYLDPSVQSRFRGIRQKDDSFESQWGSPSGVVLPDQASWKSNSETLREMGTGPLRCP
ncbi:hypothetical protein CPB86DRAFT_788305, partial [Serendipita vermifera]